MTGQPTGIDLNGLCDVSVVDESKAVLRGGVVPSVVIVHPPQENSPLRVTAGLEASGYLTKPFRVERLPARMRASLAYSSSRTLTSFDGFSRCLS